MAGRIIKCKKIVERCPENAQFLAPEYLRFFWRRDPNYNAGLKRCEVRREKGKSSVINMPQSAYYETFKDYNKLYHNS